MRIPDMKVPKAAIIVDFLNQVLKSKRNVKVGDYSTTRMRSIWGAVRTSSSDMNSQPSMKTGLPSISRNLGATAKVATGGKAIPPKEIHTSVPQHHQQGCGNF
eukprot:GHVU01042141.1.p1 GENE.GHVU01042141.1~~GHVU01042141.1.p1  ORF type:complete len:103 (+),score=11.92 GHVU01042141.1:213-521(+)